MTNKELYYSYKFSHLSSSNYSKSFLPNIFKVSLIAVFLLFIYRAISNFGVSDNPAFYLNQLVNFFGSNSFNNEFLFWTLSNFSSINYWFSSDIALFSFLGNVVELIGYIGNFVLLLLALVLQAINFIFLLFDVLFVLS